MGKEPSTRSQGFTPKFIQDIRPVRQKSRKIKNRPKEINKKERTYAQAMSNLQRRDVVSNIMEEAFGMSQLRKQIAKLCKEAMISVY